MSHDRIVAASLLGTTQARVRRELPGAIRRSEPDAREVCELITARRFVARRTGSSGEWTLSVEARRRLRKRR